MSGANILGLLGGGLLGSLLGGQGQDIASPTPPLLLPTPEQPVVSTAADIKQDAIVDAEAARRRSSKRVAEQKEKDILSGISQESKTAVSLTQTLLGE